MKNHKKSFALLLVILLIIVFSFLFTYILEIKTFQSDSQTKNYHKTQAAFHLEFAKVFLQNLNLNESENPCIEEVNISHEHYEIFAHISYISKIKDCPNSVQMNLDSNESLGVAIIDVYVKSKSSMFNIKLHERFLKKL